MRNLTIAAEFRDLPCQVCGTTFDIVGHHMIAYKRDPSLDKKENMIPLCVACHSHIHTIGLFNFVSNNNLEYYLEERGFEICLTKQKWIIPLSVKESW